MWPLIPGTCDHYVFDVATNVVGVTTNLVCETTNAFIDFGGPLTDLPLLSAVTGLNVLPLIMIVLWVWHQRSMPKPTDPQQAQMQKMMAFMPIMFGVMLYNYAAGLSLYMITSSSLGIFEQKVIFHPRIYMTSNSTLTDEEK